MRIVWIQIPAHPYSHIGIFFLPCDTVYINQWLGKQTTNILIRRRGFTGLPWLLYSALATKTFCLEKSERQWILVKRSLGKIYCVWVYIERLCRETNSKFLRNPMTKANEGLSRVLKTGFLSTIFVQDVRKRTFWHVLPSKTLINLRNLIRVIVIHIRKLCIIGYPECAQWQVLSDCANAQADLPVRWPHMSEGMFSDVVAQSNETLYCASLGV